MTGPSRIQLGGLSLALVVALALVPQASAAPPSKDLVQISNERTSTYWAHPVHNRAPIRSQPGSHGRRIVSTHLLTADGFPEIYLVLRSWTDSKGRTWLKVRIPMRPNGRKGWVRDSALGPLYHVRKQLVVDRSELRATLYKRGREIWSAPVGIGAPSTPTPPGHFWIREKFKASGGIYGPVAFGTSDYSVLTDWPGGGVIGIHGTNEPNLIPGHPSHGCIRVQNQDVSELYHLMPIGTPLLIK